MVFSSIAFLCAFLPLVFCLSLVIRQTRAQNALLICASLLFYAYGEPIYVLLMLGSSVANWLLGLAIAHCQALSRKRILLGAAVVVNLAVLCIFKYSGMIVSSINGLLGTLIPLPEITLPIGISFFTFQAMSYVIDVYRGDVKYERNFANVLLYISFFPQLIAGPIVKFHDISEQISKRSQTIEGVSLGLRRFLVGLAKKVLLANQFALVADALFAVPTSELNIATAWLATLAYMLQIYFDFSGYSDMAIGLGRMFGFEFKENFNYPYQSKSIREFWRRWHISLSTWFKEYLYIPLGGNRRGRARACMNRIIVFFLCGLWHGASWTFVVWGLYHGLFLLFEEYVIKDLRMPRVVAHIYALVVVAIGWVLFRADTLGQAVDIIQLMFTGFTFTSAQMALFFEQITPLFAFTFVVGAIGSLPISRVVAAKVQTLGANQQRIAIAASFIGAFALLALCLMELSSGGYNPFIYFRF